MTAFLLTYLGIAVFAVVINVIAAILNKSAAPRCAFTIASMLPMMAWALWLLAKGVA
ncbi:hypothetical protein [Acidovorax sp.]|uniref:hypothetical protein n=1 Tax=Acidovorax sp. TaxID=1872122 RepID=UPI0031D74A68